MAHEEAIDSAIARHGMWKAWLRQAIETGVIERSVDAIRSETLCAFGKWLCGSELSAADKASTHYATVRRVHAEFHETAARVAEFVLTGQKEEALKMMSLGGAYSAVSARLTLAMLAWKQH